MSRKCMLSENDIFDYLQTLGIIFARMLAKSIRHTKTEREVKRQESRQRLYAQMAREKDQKPTPVMYSTSKAWAANVATKYPRSEVRL